MKSRNVVRFEDVKSPGDLLHVAESWMQLGGELRYEFQFASSQGPNGFVIEFAELPVEATAIHEPCEGQGCEGCGDVGRIALRA